MYCNKCGAQMDAQTKFCPACGAPQQSDYVHEGYVVGSSSPVNFAQAFVLLFTRFSDFKGRSRRSEYWWASLAISIISTSLSLILPNLSWIWTLIVFIPSLSLSVRRLHDVGKSGWWYLLNFIPVVGQIIILVLACKDSTADNRWGVNPKA